MFVLQNIWWMLVLIGVMILIHELGHYWAARWFDVKVEAFSFGFGPRLFGFRRGETDFRFSAILFGGYVKMAGEQPGDDAAADPRSFQAKPRWQRLIIAFAGPAMNIFLAVALLTGLFMYKYPKPANADDPARVGYVVPGSPAHQAGVQEGDVILQLDDIRAPKWEDVVLHEIASAKREMAVKVRRGDETLLLNITPVLDEKTGAGSSGWAEWNEVEIAGILAGMDAAKQGLERGDVFVSVAGHPISSAIKLNEIVSKSGGKPLEVHYRRDGGMRTATITPTYAEEEKRWMLGVQLANPVVYTQLPFTLALKESITQNIKGASLILQFLQGLVERRMSAKSLEGPIGIARLAGDHAREGAAPFFSLMAMVSLNLAIFNLLPIPILDGGLILMLLVEMIMRRDLSLQVKEAVLKAGMVFLMAVVVFVLYNDISKLLPG
jgi:regulator of sigma E protease